MAYKNNQRSRLQLLAGGLEEIVLKSTDKELLGHRSSGETRDIRRLIASAARDYSAESRGRTSEKPALSDFGSEDEKLAFLKWAMKSGVGVPQQLRAAFASKNPLSDSEINAMVNQLIRLGVKRSAK